MLYIYLLLLVLTVRYFRYKQPLSYSLAIFYLFSAVCAILFWHLDPSNIYFIKTEYFPLLFLFVVIFIWFSGFSRFKAFQVPQSPAFKRKFNRICTNIGLLYLPFVAILLYNAARVVLLTDLTSYRIEADWYSVLQGGIFLSLGIYLSVLSFVPHILLFLSFHYNSPRYTKVLLLIASLSFVFTTLCFAGRDGVVYWLMNSIVYYFLFQSGYTRDFKKTLIRYSLIVGGVLVMPLIVISAARFTSGDTSFSELFLPILSYIGQPPHIFCQSFYFDPSTIRSLDTSAMTQGQFEASQIYLTYTFGTFVKKYYWAYGALGTIGISFLYSVVAHYFVKIYNATGSIWIFFIIYTIYQIPLYGVFYYRQNLQKMELIYILFCVFCLFQYFNTKHSSVKL